MLIAWAYNELGENISPLTQTFDLRFSRPRGASSGFEFKINNERMFSDNWGAKTALVDITVDDIIRGYNTTAPTYHKTGDAAWIRNAPDELDTSEMLIGPTVSSDDFTGGDIYSIISDGAGGYYVGGDFTTVGGAGGYKGLAHVDAHGQVLSDWAPVLAGGSAVARALYRLDNGYVVVAGNFDTVDGAAADGLALIDADGNLVADLSQAATTNAFAITANDTYLFVGGQNLTGVLASVIKFRIENLKAGGNTPETYEVFATGGLVRTMVADGDILYLGGTFTGILVINDPGPAQESRNYLAAVKANVELDSTKLNQQMFDALLPWEPNADAQVNAMVLHDGYIYVGGDFTDIGGTGTTRLARVDEDGVLDATWTPAAIDDQVYALGLITSTRSGVAHLVVGGLFTTPEAFVYLINIDTAADSWAPTPDAEVRTVLPDGGRIVIGGDFANLSVGPFGAFAIIPDQFVASEIGVYKLEWVDPGVLHDTPISVRFQIFDGGTEDATEILDEIITEYVQDQNGIHFESSQFTLERVGNAGLYLIKAIVVRENSVQTEHTVLESATQAGVVLVPDGVEEGDQYDQADTFAAPGVAKVGSVYQVTPDQEAGTPVSTNPTHYFRMWLLVAPSSNIIDDYRVTFGGATDTVDITDTRYYSERIGYPTNGNTTITVLARDSATTTIVSTGPHAVTASAASTIVDADQIQVEYEYTDGAWAMRIITDWQPIPGGGLFSYPSIGPAAYQFRFRYRYRTFRRDGIEDETRRPVMTSSWSAWSTLA